jgi:hypothetical protein
MTKIKLAIFAKNVSATSKENFIAYALLLKGSKRKLICEIHIGKKVARFKPHLDYFLEDVLWELNIHCRLPISEIEREYDYPELIKIEDEIGEKKCLEIKKIIERTLAETQFSYSVMNFSALDTDVEDKINKLKNHGVRIELINSSI